MTLARMTDQVAVIVDAQSTGALFAPAFAAYGFASVHVRNRTEHCPALAATVAPETFRECLDHTGDFAALWDRLRRHRIGFVLVGTDSGVELADRIAHAAGLPTANPVATSPLRRDKHLMQHAVAAAGLPVARHAVARSAAEALAAVPRLGGFPVVVKPLRSAGTDGVSVCRAGEDLAAAVTGLLARPTMYGTPIEEVLVQEHLAGEEYMVNTIAVAGRVYVLEVWRSVKRLVGGAPVYDYSELLPGDAPGVAEIAGYVRGVVAAVGQRHGLGHTEVIRTAAGPRLVETAARAMGTTDPAALTRASGVNPVTLAVHHAIDPDFYAAHGVPEMRVLRATRGVSFICPVEGTLTAELPFDRVRALPSFHSLLAPARVGQRLGRTRDLLSRPGAVYLIHPDPEVVRRDHATIRTMEQTEFYRDVCPA